MSSFDATSSIEEAILADSDFSEYAQKLVAYSREYHLESPSTSPSDCMEIGAGKLIGEYGNDRGQLAQVAMSEIAAKWVFG